MSDLQTSAVRSPGAAAVSEGWQPQIVALVCNWCTYAGADMAGTTRLEYPATVRMVRFPCTGRMSPLMILRAFEQGADGVLVSGCHPGDCHYVQGNLVARRRFTIFRSLLDFLGIDLRRLHFAWVSAAEGHKWARVVKDVSAAVAEAGPLPRPSAEPWDGPELPAAGGGGPAALADGELEALRANLRAAASELLSSGRAAAVVGYRAGSLEGRLVPVTVTDAAGCRQLEWGPGSLNNLATYAKAALEKADTVALVAKTCDLGAVTGLIREGQITREKVRLIGVQCQGVRPGGGEPADKCLSCSGAPHPMCDLVVTVDGVRESCADPASEPVDTEDARDRQIASLESLPADERWRFWQRQFGRCLRCYACRAVCPLCYCSSCIADKHRPQWVPTAIDERGNSAWNVIRAVHLAGRCSGCDECARVCPADIRLDLINRKLALEVERHFGAAGLDPEQKSALVDFRMEDAEEFIL